MIKNFITLTGLLLLPLVAAFFGFVTWSRAQLNTPLQVTGTQNFIFEMPNGASVRRLPLLLVEQGLLEENKAGSIQTALRFELRKNPELASVKTGEYDLTEAEKFIDVLTLLQTGDVIKHSLTIIEGTRFQDLRVLLASKSNLKQTLVNLPDATVMAELGKENMHPEGWFAPDTYFYTSSDSDMDILKRALSLQENRLKIAWEARIENLPYHSPYDMLIMASIIERETGVASEREDIAGVFIRRMQIGMRLQTDPTVIYGMGENYKGRITRADLRTPTPYNTYTINGLPPTPIALPGAKAIEAAANPAVGKSLYFVAKGDGSHYFSNTLAEHERAVRRYQLNRRTDYRSSPTEASK